LLKYGRAVMSLDCFSSWVPFLDRDELACETLVADPLSPNYPADCPAICHPKLRVRFLRAKLAIGPHVVPVRS